MFNRRAYLQHIFMEQIFRAILALPVWRIVSITFFGFKFRRSSNWEGFLICIHLSSLKFSTYCSVAKYRFESFEIRSLWYPKVAFHLKMILIWLHRWQCQFSKLLNSSHKLQSDIYFSQSVKIFRELNSR